jgi:hypothetical protein
MKTNLFLIFFPNDKKDTGNKVICARLAFAILLSGFIIAGLTSAYGMDRSLPDKISPGQSFTVTYSFNPQEELYVSWNDRISGGCSPSLVSGTMQSSISTTAERTFTAPNEVTQCKFEGYYQFQDGITKNFPTISIQVGTPPVPVPVVNNTDNVTYIYQPVQNQTIETPAPQFSVCTITSKFAFFHILPDCYEGTILLLVGLFIIYKMFK